MTSTSVSTFLGVQLQFLTARKHDLLIWRELFAGKWALTALPVKQERADLANVERGVDRIATRYSKPPGNHSVGNCTGWDCIANCQFRSFAIGIISTCGQGQLIFRCVLSLSSLFLASRFLHAVDLYAPYGTIHLLQEGKSTASLHHNLSFT